MPVYDKHRTHSPRLHRTPQQRLENDAEDLRLLRRLQEGDEHAFWALWMKHAPRLFGLCLREMQGNRVDAEDALEEAMLRAHAKLPRFAATIVAPASWLARMTSNVCKDFYRARARGLTT
ncbi:MAG TPA: sigma factor, partial [Thermoanaerobaculia bacterium]|nr:sigma factor [Thermoanaerobaculia bacterium]